MQNTGSGRASVQILCLQCVTTLQSPLFFVKLLSLLNTICHSFINKCNCWYYAMQYVINVFILCIMNTGLINLLLEDPQTFPSQKTVNTWFAIVTMEESLWQFFMSKLWLSCPCSGTFFDLLEPGKVCKGTCSFGSFSG